MGILSLLLTFMMFKECSSGVGTSNFNEMIFMLFNLTGSPACIGTQKFMGIV